MKLNDKMCRNARPEAKARKLADGGGLYLEVTPRGTKLWRLKYRYLGREKKLSLGSYPTITLADARKARDAAKKALAAGHDPSAQKKAEKRERAQEATNTFEVIAREWHTMKTPEWSAVNAKTVLDRLERDVFPALGAVPIKAITHTMLLDLANGVKARGAHELAKRIIQMARHIFQYAIITGRAEVNIAADLKGLIKPQPTRHFAAIETADLPAFLADLDAARAGMQRQTYLALRFMMLTFVRTGEMIGARWEEIDWEARQWIVPAMRMKMSKEHIVPLSCQALEVLHDLRALHDNATLVFPSRTNPKATMSNNTILMALERMGYRGRMTGHGFRALAMSAAMEKLGYRHEVPDAQLAHAKRGDVARAYDRAKFLPERVRLMQDWADYLDTIAVGGATVVPLRPLSATGR
ncbi:MAG: integrase arm-type DNA-binding domain-containing protein [Alphaproteobacteria bacterium]|jgi:integrase|nr:integrase arm-type DNA-binding domain-containing protein [Alphaproteobacteria bacterium]